MRVRFFRFQRLKNKHFANSFVLIKESCKCLGGKLLELETSEENEFIKDEVRTLNTGGEFLLLLVQIYNNMMSIKQDTNIKEFKRSAYILHKQSHCILYE